MKFNTLLLIGICLTACGKDDKGGGGGGGKTTGGSTAPSGGGGGGASTDCLVGSWVTEFGDKNVYTFNADKTGSRVYKTEAPEAFTWTLTDGSKGKVDFPAHGDVQAASFKFEVDCAKPAFRLEGVGFKKQ